MGPYHNILHCYGKDCYGMDIILVISILNNSYALKHGSKSGLLLRNVIGSICQNQTFLKVFNVLKSRYGQWTHIKYTLVGLLTETVFSFSSSVEAFQNISNACLQTERALSAWQITTFANMRDPVSFWQFITALRYGHKSRDRFIILAHQIEKSNVLLHVRNSYLTLVISPRRMLHSSVLF